MEFELNKCTYNPNPDFKFASALYFTKNLHFEIVISLFGSDILPNKPIKIDHGEIYVVEQDFHLISSKDRITIYWLYLDYDRIREYNNKIVNYLGVSKYYWDIYCRGTGKFIAQCVSGEFEMDDEIIVSNMGEFYERKFSHIIDSLPNDN